MKFLWFFGLLVWLSVVPCLAEEGSSRIIRTVDDALNEVLVRNPLVASLPFELEARDNLVFQAGRGPNPNLDLTTEQFGEQVQGSNASQAEVRLSQRIERGGKLAARVGVASAEKERARIEAQIAVLELVGEVRKSWAKLASLVAERKLREEQLRFSNELVGAVRRRVEAGATLPAELLKAQTTVETDEIELNRVIQEIALEKQVLTSFWAGDSFQVPDDAFSNIQPTALVSGGGALGQSLQAQLSKLEVLTSERNLLQERAKGYQDVTVAAGYQRLQGIKYNTFLLSLSVPLPFSDRNQGAILSAQNSVSAATLRSSNSVLRLESRQRSLESTLRTFEFERKQLTDVVIPQAQRTVKEHLNAFSLGKASFLDVADAQRTLLAAKSRKLEVERLRSEASVDLDILTADKPMPLPERDKRP